MHGQLQARKVVQAAPPEDELAGFPLPLMARYAGHWQARTKHHKAPTLAVEAQPPLTPMEQLLGKGTLCTMPMAPIGLTHTAGIMP